MEPKNNGGAAFPTSESNYNAKYSGEGMTLRDYFAAKVMPTMVSMCQYADGEWDHGTVAQNAYALADAMLAERAK